MRYLVFLSLLSVSACKKEKEPTGTPVTLTTSPTTPAEETYDWRKASMAYFEEEPPRLDEALYASAQSLRAMRPCFEAPDGATCTTAWGPSWWRRAMIEGLSHHAMVLAAMGKGKFALKAADEAKHIDPSAPFIDRARGDALFALGRYGDSAKAFQDALDNGAPNQPTMRVRMARAMFRDGQKTEAKTLAAEVAAKMAADTLRMNPSTVAHLSTGHGEFNVVRKELEALATETGP